MRHHLLFLGVLALTGCQQAKQEAAKTTEAKPAPPVEIFKVDPATAGTVRGSVRFTGKKPPVKMISMDAEEACQAMHKGGVPDASLVSSKGGGLANVLVYVKSGLEGKHFATPPQAVMIDQRGCQFIPRVVALQTGQTLDVKNSDPVSHNIHPKPENNREWNQQQQPGAPDLTRRFSRPEVVIPVRCNVHAWMRSNIAVLEHPFFAVTNEAGEFTWPPLPPGEYTVAAWHETLGEKTMKLMVGKGAQENVKFTFE